MTPKLWPSRLNYAQESISPELNLNLFRNFFSVAPDQDNGSYCSLIENGCVHPDICIKKIDESLKVDGEIHPLCHQKTEKGHTNYGVFASKNIPAGTPLGEYICELYLLPNPELLEAFFEQHSYREYTWFIKVNGFIVILDGSQRSNELALVNSFIGLKSQPNVKMKAIAHQGYYYFCYVTESDIQEGEEILVDYGKKNLFDCSKNT